MLSDKKLNGSPSGEFDKIYAPEINVKKILSPDRVKVKVTASEPVSTIPSPEKTSPSPLR